MLDLVQTVPAALPGDVFPPVMTARRAITVVGMTFAARLTFGPQRAQPLDRIHRSSEPQAGLAWG
jgi:hypothetical protein